MLMTESTGTSPTYKVGAEVEPHFSSSLLLGRVL